MTKDEKTKVEKTKVEKTQEEEFAEDEQVLKIKGSDEKPTFWKPKKVGEILEGKLIAITEGNFGKTLKMSTKKGIVGINVNVFLADIDFMEYQEQRLRFTFKGLVGKRGCRVYDVDRVLAKDEAPF